MFVRAKAFYSCVATGFGQLLSQLCIVVLLWPARTEIWTGIFENFVRMERAPSLPPILRPAPAEDDRFLTVTWYRNSKLGNHAWNLVTEKITKNMAEERYEFDIFWAHKFHLLYVYEHGFVQIIWLSLVLAAERVGGGHGVQNSSRVFAKRWLSLYVVLDV